VRFGYARSADRLLRLDTRIVIGRAARPRQDRDCFVAAI
jgi:hypothetical protein